MGIFQLPKSTEPNKAFNGFFRCVCLSHWVLFFQIFVEKPDTSIHVQYQNGDSSLWGWAATTTTLDYQTNFKPLNKKQMMREMRFSNGTFIPVSISGFQIELERKVSESGEKCYI